MRIVHKILISAICLGTLACGGSNDPKIKSISPVEGPEAGGINITILGNHFVEILEVLIGGANCQPITVVSEKELTCVLGANPAVITDAIVDVEIRNINGDNGKLRNAFTYRAD